MLQAYSSLFPYEYDALKDDEYIKAASGRLASHEAIVFSNIESARLGVLILPCTLHDIDDDTCEFRDGLGRPITTEITKVNSGNGWIDVSYNGPISNTDEIYSTKGSIVFVRFILEPVLYNKTITGNISTDGKLFSKEFYTRLEFLYNMRLGCKYVTADETIDSFDQTTGEMTTDKGDYILEYPMAVKYDVGDTVLEGNFIDKVVDLSLEPPYVQITLKKDYAYLRKVFTFDSNKIINIID
jgi:hypothetical protein